jgi:hypothetical protein
MQPTALGGIMSAAADAGAVGQTALGAQLHQRIGAIDDVIALPDLGRRAEPRYYDGSDVSVPFSECSSRSTAAKSDASRGHMQFHWSIAAYSFEGSRR